MVEISLTDYLMPYSILTDATRPVGDEKTLTYPILTEKLNTNPPKT
jgi:hypothetical protein